MKSGRMFCFTHISTVKAFETYDTKMSLPSHPYSTMLLHPVSAQQQTFCTYIYMYLRIVIWLHYKFYTHITHPVPFYDKSSTHFAISGEKTKLPDIIILLDSKTQLKGSNR